MAQEEGLQVPRGQGLSHSDFPPVTTTPPPVTDPTTTTSVTSAQLQAMIDEGVTAVLAARATTRNGDDSHTSGTGARRNERPFGSCTFKDFMKCQPLFFRGTEGVVNLTQWFERMETCSGISNAPVENYSEVCHLDDKIEDMSGGMPVQTRFIHSVVDRSHKTTQEDLRWQSDN
ncbi:hypothetical protein Tco_1134834 [Tanacetum coccineum]